MTHSVVRITTMNETIKQVLLSSFMSNSKSQMSLDKHHKRGWMLPHHVQIRKKPEGAHTPNRMPYLGQHRCWAGKQAGCRVPWGRKNQWEAWFCLSCIHYKHGCERIAIDVVPPCQVSESRSSGWHVAFAYCRLNSYLTLLRCCCKYFV